MLTLLLLLLQSAQLSLQIAERPFPVRVFYTGEASTGSARLEIEADWGDIQPTEISILNYTTAMAAEVKSPQIKGRRYIVNLAQAFHGDLPYGPNMIGVSVRSEEGVRTVVDKIEVMIR